MRTPEPSATEQWHLSKSVPVTLIGAMVCQLLIAGWMARGLVAEMQETRREAQETIRRVVVLEQARNPERLAVVESRTATTEAAVLRVEADVKRLLERK